MHTEMEMSVGCLEKSSLKETSDVFEVCLKDQVSLREKK